MAPCLPGTCAEHLCSLHGSVSPLECARDHEGLSIVSLGVQTQAHTVQRRLASLYPGSRLSPRVSSPFSVHPESQETKQVVIILVNGTSQRPDTCGSEGRWFTGFCPASSSPGAGRITEGGALEDSPWRTEKSPTALSPRTSPGLAASPRGSTAPGGWVPGPPGLPAQVLLATVFPAPGSQRAQWVAGALAASPAQLPAP